MTFPRMTLFAELVTALCLSNCDVFAQQTESSSDTLQPVKVDEFQATRVKMHGLGTVAGRIMCSDTQRPARLAQVKLVKVPTKAELKAIDADKGSPDDAASAGNAVETSLDGSYVFHHVKPGTYYVVVDKAGYLIPLAQFSKKELGATDDETRAKVAKAVHAIAVDADATVNEDVVLDRGASVSGTVTYDDGTPASVIGIQLLVKDKDGKWKPTEVFRYRSFYGLSTTDDNGFYRIAGLPAGEYAIEADLSLNDHETTFGPMPGNPSTMVTMEMTKTRFSLPVYSGDVLRKTKATGYVIGRGEARAGSDLVFPLAKLHKVGGQVIANDGHAVNGGDIKLLWADDQSQMTEASVQYDDAAFHLEFVPEGEFTLKVAGAKDTTKMQVENAPGYQPRFHEESRTLKTYGDGQVPLVVVGDTSDVVLPVGDGGKAQ